MFLTHLLFAFSSPHYFEQLQKRHISKIPTSQVSCPKRCVTSENEGTKLYSKSSLFRVTLNAKSQLAVPDVRNDGGAQEDNRE